MVFRAHRLFCVAPGDLEAPSFFLENSILDIVLLKRILTPSPYSPRKLEGAFGFWVWGALDP